MVVGRLLFYWEGNFSGAMLNFRGGHVFVFVGGRISKKKSQFWTIEPFCYPSSHPHGSVEDGLFGDYTHFPLNHDSGEKEYIIGKMDENGGLDNPPHIHLCIVGIYWVYPKGTTIFPMNKVWDSQNKDIYKDSTLSQLWNLEIFQGKKRIPAKTGQKSGEFYLRYFKRYCSIVDLCSETKNKTAACLWVKKKELTNYLVYLQHDFFESSKYENPILHQLTWLQKNEIFALYIFCLLACLTYKLIGWHFPNSTGTEISCGSVRRDAKDWSSWKESDRSWRSYRRCGSFLEVGNCYRYRSSKKNYLGVSDWTCTSYVTSWSL